MCNDAEKMDMWNFTVGEMIDMAFSHNAIIALWCKENEMKENKDILVYRGMAWATPDEYLSLKVKEFFGVIPENIVQADTINILVEGDDSTITIGIPAKKHDISDCMDGGKNEC